MDFKKIFFNKVGQLRTVFKLFLFVIIFQIVGFVILRLVVPFFKESSFYLSFMVNLLSLISVLIALGVYMRFIDKSSFEKFGLHARKNTLRNVGYGLLLGVTAILLILFFQLNKMELEFTPGTSFHGYSLAATYLAQFIRYFCGSFFEELLTSSFLFILVFEGLVPTVKMHYRRYALSIIVSALVFGLIHGLHPDAGPIGILNLILFGALTTTNFARTQSLAFPITFHCMWNFTQNIIMGLPNSGQESQAWIFKASLQSNSILTGGKFGLEGSLVASFLLLTILIYELRLLTKII